MNNRYEVIKLYSFWLYECQRLGTIKVAQSCMAHEHAFFALDPKIKAKIEADDQRGCQINTKEAEPISESEDEDDANSGSI